MTDLFTDYPLLRMGILLGLFALVAAGGYFIASAVAARQMSRSRLVEGDMGSHQVVGASLRSQEAESAWLRPAPVVRYRVPLLFASERM